MVGAVSLSASVADAQATKPDNSAITANTLTTRSASTLTLKSTIGTGGGSTNPGIVFQSQTDLGSNDYVFVFKDGNTTRMYLDGSGIWHYTGGAFYMEGGTEFVGDMFRTYGGTITVLGNKQSGTTTTSLPNLKLGAYFYDLAGSDYNVCYYSQAARNAPELCVMGSGKLVYDTTDSSGTPGAATINKASGKVSIAASAASVVVTDSAVTASSIVTAVFQATDATCTFIKSVVPAAGSFTVTANANCTAAAKVGFIVSN